MNLRILPVALLLVVVAACSTAGSSPATTTTATPSGPTTLNVYPEGPSTAIRPGTYVTASPMAFLPGLTLQITDGWELVENDSGEFQIHRVDNPDDVLLLWEDMAAVVTNDRDQTLGQLLPDVGTTAAELTTYLTTSPDFTVLSPPEQVTVAGSIEGTQFTFQVSDSADYADPQDCPDGPRCALVLTQPVLWPGSWGIGGDETARMFIATIRHAENDHTFFITLDAPTTGDLDELAAAAEPIIQSLELPDGYVDVRP